MKNIVRALGVLAFVAVAIRTVPAHADSTTGTCKILCTKAGDPPKLTTVTESGVTEGACCSGQVVQCPAGYTPGLLTWGNPPRICT
jgi:hypothetical protein